MPTFDFQTPPDRPLEFVEATTYKSTKPILRIGCGIVVPLGWCIVCERYRHCLYEPHERG
jgi:hypothetical protein